MANFIGRLGVILGLDSAEFQKGIASANKSLDKFVSSAQTTAKVGAAAFAAMAYQALQLADEIVDTAKANDMAVDSVLKLRNALALSGGEAQNAGKFLSSFTANIDKAAEGSFEVQKTFKSLGVSLSDLRRLDIDSLLNKSLLGLRDMADPITRNAKAMELFGKAAKGVDFAELNSEIQRGAGVTNEQAKAIKDAADSYDVITQAGRDFSIMIASELGPSIKTVIDYFKQTQSAGLNFGSGIKIVFDTLAILGANVIFVFKAVVLEVEAVFNFLNTAATKGFAEASRQNDIYIQKTIESRKKLDQFEKSILQEPPEQIDDRREFARLPARAEPIRRQVKEGKDKDAQAERKKQLDIYLKGLAEEQKQSEENLRLLAEQESMYQKGNAAQIMRQRIAGMDIQREKEILELLFQNRFAREEDIRLAQDLKQVEWSRLDAIEKIGQNDELTRKAKEESIEKENQLAKEAINLAMRRNELAKEMREGTLSEGFFSAMESAAKNASTEFERGKEVFESVMSNMDNAITQFTRNGKLAFKDFARSIIQDILAIYIKSQMLQMIKGFGSLFSGGGGVNPGGLDASGGMGEAVMSFAMAADGGYISGPTVVGENGPELFIPRTAGTIVPNQQMAGMTGSPQVVYNGPYIANMQAIDTQSAAQFLARNKESVWAANQSASRSVPQSR
jgi:lambda family phage tail tape measure protein